MITHAKKVFILGLPAILLLFLYTPLLAAESPQIFLSAEHNSQDITISVQVASLPLIYGADVHLTFDPTILEVTQLESGSFMDPTQGTILQNQHDNEAGTIDYALALRNPAPPVEGAGELLRVTFRAKSDAQTTINLERARFGRRLAEGGEGIDPILGENVTLNVTNGEVELTSPPEPAPELPSETAPTSPTSETAVIGGENGLSDKQLILIGLVAGSMLLGGQFLFLRRRDKT